MPSLDVPEVYRQLHDKCGEIVSSSMVGENAEAIAKSHQFSFELEKWSEVLGSRAEVELLRNAAVEYNFALLALAQGHYRQSFNALRLVLELTLQSILLSSNEICLREWMDNRIDTIWSSILDETNGVFSSRFARAFFPDLESHTKYYRSLAGSIYRECSECIHGNIPKHVPLSMSLEFSQDIFDLWHSKASVVTLIVHFALSLRYLADLSETSILELEKFLNDRLGHLEEIRRLFGGPSKG